MRKLRRFAVETFYHVTSRTNNKIRVFENKLGRKIMLITLQDAKDKYKFVLTNFCIMPTHIHLLIKPAIGTKLNVIMQWIKTRSAKNWNCIHGSIDHVWGERYFARELKNMEEYEYVMNYIDKNPVAAGLAGSPEEWKASGAYYSAKNISGLVDFNPNETRKHTKLLSPIPPLVSQILPQGQLSHVLKYFGVNADAINQLYKIVKTMPRLGEMRSIKNPLISLRYFTDTVDYFIYEFDGLDTMYGKIRKSIFPFDVIHMELKLSEIKNICAIKLDLSWDVCNENYLHTATYSVLANETLGKFGD